MVETLNRKIYLIVALLILFGLGTGYILCEKDARVKEEKREAYKEVYDALQIDVEELVGEYGEDINVQDFVKSSMIAGMPQSYIMASDILPNTVAPILVFATSVMAISILDEATLSFLGMGVQPPDASLGNLLNGAESITVLTQMPWMWLSPGVMIVVLVICVNFIGDALRDAMDPTTIR